MKKVVLAYSGGLDTTFCALHLTKDLGYEVHAVIVNTGGFTKEELTAIETRANSLGVASFNIFEVLDTY
jgi:argininosuccinate synthase